jgi:hypothetical protein
MMLHHMCSVHNGGCELQLFHRTVRLTGDSLPVAFVGW